jgi:hypothetical protein
VSDQIRQCDAGHLSLGAGNWECPWCKLAEANERLRLCEVPDGWEAWRIKAEAEVERLRDGAEVARLKADMSQVQHWAEGLVIETQRLQGIEAEVARLRRERDAALVHGPEDMVRALEEAQAEVERLTQMMERIGEDVLPDPVRYADLTPEIVRDAFIQRWNALSEELGEVLFERDTLRAALDEIAKGEGRYNRDPLTHASNTIEDMQALAIAALRGEGEK